MCPRKIYTAINIKKHLVERYLREGVSKLKQCELKAQIAPSGRTTCDF